MRAKITRLIKDRGFGFIKDDEGLQYFFHMTAIDPKENLTFDELTEGMDVEFKIEESPKGPRAAPRSLKLIPVSSDR